MPRGYLKHNKDVGRKSARGGGSHSNRASIRGTIRRCKAAQRVMICEHTGQENHSTADDPFWEASSDEDISIDYFDGSSAESSLGENKAHPVGECPICLETVPVVRLSKKCGWHEAACQKCLRRIHVTEAQKSAKKFPLACFHPQCQQPVHLAQLQKHNLICSPEEIKRHHELQLLSKANKMKDPHTVFCPHCDFPRVFGKELTGHDRSHTCRNCQEPFLVSPDYATIRTLERLQNDKRGANHGWGRCPKCSILISKGDGCSEMQCSYCDCVFDWRNVVGGRPPLARPRDSDIYLWW